METLGGGAMEDVEGKEQDGIKDKVRVGVGTGRETKQEPESEAEETEEKGGPSRPRFHLYLAGPSLGTRGTVLRVSAPPGKRDPQIRPQPPSREHRLVGQPLLPWGAVCPVTPRGWSPVRPQRS